MPGELLLWLTYAAALRFDNKGNHQIPSPLKRMSRPAKRIQAIRVMAALAASRAYSRRVRFSVSAVR